MNSKKVLIFDIESEYGHFRKYNTTTSPLTYSIPTRTAVAGILGAILGMEREIRDGVFPEGAEPVQEFFSKERADIAVQLLRPVKKETIGINLVNTKNSFNNLSVAGRTQINFEFLREPAFRIYFAMEEEPEIFEELVERIKTKKHHFTPYLGIAQCTADVIYRDVRQAVYKQNGNNDYVDVVTAVNLSKVAAENPVQFDYSAFYAANTMPLAMNRNREVLEYSDVLIERTGKPVKVKVPEYYHVEGYGNIVFL